MVGRSWDTNTTISRAEIITPTLKSQMLVCFLGGWRKQRERSWVYSKQWRRGGHREGGLQMVTWPRVKGIFSFSTREVGSKKRKGDLNLKPDLRRQDESESEAEFFLEKSNLIGGP